MQKKVDYTFPLNFNIESTNACNLNCKGCPRNISSRKVGFIEWDLFKKIVDESAQYGPRTMALHKDGEPLLHPKIIDMIKYIKKQNENNYVYLTTNGHFLTEKISKKIIENRTDVLHLSLGAATEKTYRIVRGEGFEKVINNIERFLELKEDFKTDLPKVYLQIIRMEETENEIKEFIQNWKRYKVTINVVNFMNWGGVENDATLNKINYGRRYPCPYLWFFPSINWDGDVSICCFDWNKQHIIGNVKNQQLAEIWQSETIKKFRSFHLNGEYDKIELCKNCNGWVTDPDIFFFWQKRKI